MYGEALKGIKMRGCKLNNKNRIKQFYLRMCLKYSTKHIIQAYFESCWELKIGFGKNYKREVDKIWE